MDLFKEDVEQSIKILEILKRKNNGVQNQHNLFLIILVVLEEEEAEEQEILMKMKDLVEVEEEAILIGTKTPT